LLLFIVSFVVLVSIVTSLPDADIDRVLKGVDYEGTICEGSAGQYAAWPSVFSFDAYQIKICVDDCAETLTDDRMIVQYETSPYLYYCLPVDFEAILFNSTSASSGSGEWSFSTTFSDAMADVSTTWGIILLSMFLAVMFAFAFTKLAGSFACCFIVISSALALLLGMLGGYFLVEEAEVSRLEGDTDTADVMEYCGYAVWIVTLLLACVLFYLRDAIELAVNILKAAGDAFRAVPSLAFFPIVPFMIGGAYIVFWGWASLSIASVSLEETLDMPAEFSFNENWSGITTYIDYSFDTAYTAHFAFAFFHMLWTVQFLIYFNYLVQTRRFSRVLVSNT
jgi:hypothetical protein